MSYPNSLYADIGAYTSNDLAQLQVIGMRRNSFVIALCSLIGLASVVVYGFQLNLILPVVVVAIVSFLIGVYVNESYLVTSQRVLVGIALSTIVYLSLVSQSISTTILFVPLLTFVFFLESSFKLRVFYVVVSVVALYFTFLRFWPDVGLAGISLSNLSIEAVTDCILATIFTGIFIRSHSVFSRLTIEVAKTQASRLAESVNQTKATIKALEERRSHLSKVREQTSCALDNERLAAREIRASQEQLEQFAYAASHDLKEPIRTVRSFYQVIRRRISPEVLAKAEIASLMELVEKRSASMHTMLERLLLLSRLSSNEGKVQQVSLQTVLEDTLNLHKVNPALILDIQEVAKEVAMDVRCVRRVFEEVISNSILFANTDSPLAISFTAERNRPGFVACTLRDNGRGIAKDHLPKVVGMFQRFGGTEEHTGSGLGLSIAKAIVSRAGGNFWLTSDGKSGTTVHFELPVPLDK